MRSSHHLFSILLTGAVAFAAPAPEAAPEADHQAPGSLIQGLGRYLKRALGLEMRDGISYYGDYGAYGEYGSYGSYSDIGAEISAKSKTTTTQATTTLTTSITLSVSTALSSAVTEVSTDDLTNNHVNG